MIEVFENPACAEEWAREHAARGATLGFVPTMGALHEGHLQLVRRAAAANDAACVSVFVNPLQFDRASDLASYPRDFAGDVRLLEGVGCGMVFTGELGDFFPEAVDDAGRVDDARIASEPPGPAAQGLEGAHRPGHFEGVATICRRLFELVRPTRAYFGEKDFQQTLVVRDLAARLGFPEIVVCPTSREQEGLARSSRNLRLGAADRDRALALSRALFRARELWRNGERGRDALEGAMRSELGQVELEYAEVRDPEAFGGRPQRLERAQALVAARVGDVRLIDTLRLDEASAPVEAEAR